MPTGFYDPAATTAQRKRRRPPFAYRPSRLDCSAERQCAGAVAVADRWSDAGLWGPELWSAFDLPRLSACRPCLGCPVALAQGNAA